MQCGEGAAVGDDDIADTIDDSFALIGLLWEPGDGEVALVHLNETNTTQCHAARHKQTRADGHHLALIDLGFANFDLKQRRGGIIRSLRRGGSFSDDEANFVGLENFAIHQHLLRWNDKLARLRARDAPGELGGKDTLVAANLDVLRGRDAGIHPDLNWQP